jgi:hypothetical protein
MLKIKFIQEDTFAGPAEVNSESTKSLAMA